MIRALTHGRDEDDDNDDKNVWDEDVRIDRTGGSTGDEEVSIRRGEGAAALYAWGLLSEFGAIAKR